jgi:acetolactate synthase I/II/III large subunit
MRAWCTVVGAAAARGGPALAIIGDGALHMQDEINAAVRYALPAIWVVLNDSGLGCVRAGMSACGHRPFDGDYPFTDFAAVARAKGARGLRVKHARDLEAALHEALDGRGPCVVDVIVDRDARPPIGARSSR